MYRIVRRDHPEGWRTVGEAAEQREAEQQGEDEQT